MADFLSGKLLIASPYLNDPNFLRSVVLIVSHDDEGAFGLSLNRPTDQRLSQVVELSMPTGAVREDDLIFEGGPVDGPLLALHDLTGIGSPIGLQSAGIWLTGDEDHLRLLLTRIDVQVRFAVARIPAGAQANWTARWNAADGWSAVPIASRYLRTRSEFGSVP